MGGATILIIASMIVFIVFAVYRSAAHHRRIHTPDGLFAPFTPLRRLGLSLAGALIAGGTCAWQYADYLGDDARGLAAVFSNRHLYGIMDSDPLMGVFRAP